MKTLIITAVLLCSPTIALSNNNFFMPGDAFFPTSLTENELKTLVDSDVQKYKFSYDSYGTWDGAFCGNAGFSSATFTKIDMKFAENLSQAYELIREDYPKLIVETKQDRQVKQRETNPVRVLFYRADFPYKSPTGIDSPPAYLGIRYNENWVEESVKFGHSRHRIRMCNLVRDERAIMTCWRDGDRFPGLEARIPEDFNYKASLRGESDTPVRIDGDIKAIVLPPEPLLEYFRFDTGYYADHAGEVYLPVYIVTSDGIKKIELHHDPFQIDDDGFDEE